MNFSVRVCNRMVLGAMLGVFGLACAVQQRQVQSEPMTTETVVQRDENVPALETTTLVLNFNAGEAKLSKAEKDALATLMQKSKYDLVTDQISVAVWSDRALPADGSPMKKKDVRLAARRSEQIRKFLKEQYKVSKLVLYNMAEQTNWAAHAFNTKDSEVKLLFSKDQAAPMSDADFNLIKLNGAEGKAVLVISHL